MDGPSLFVWRVEEGRFELTRQGALAAQLTSSFSHIRRATESLIRRRRKTEEGAATLPSTSSALGYACALIISSFCEELERHALMEIKSVCSIQCDSGASQHKKLETFRDMLVAVVEHSPKWSALIDAPHHLIGMLQAVDVPSVSHLESTVKRLAEVWSTIVATISFHFFSDKILPPADKDEHDGLWQQVLALLSKAVRQQRQWAANHGSPWTSMKERLPLRAVLELPGESMKERSVNASKALGRVGANSFTSNAGALVRTSSMTGRTSNNRSSNNRLLLTALASSGSEITPSSPKLAKARVVQPAMSSFNAGNTSNASAEDVALSDWCSTWSAWSCTRLSLDGLSTTSAAPEASVELIKSSSIAHFHHLSSILSALLNSTLKNLGQGSSSHFVSPQLLERQLICSSPERLRRLSSCPPLLLLPCLKLKASDHNSEAAISRGEERNLQAEMSVTVEASRICQTPTNPLLLEIDTRSGPSSSLAAKAPIKNQELPSSQMPFAANGAVERSRSASPVMMPQSSPFDDQALLDSVMALELAQFAYRMRKTMCLDGICVVLSLAPSILKVPESSSLFVPSLVISRPLVHPHLSQADFMLLGSLQTSDSTPSLIQDKLGASASPLTPMGISTEELSSSELQSKSLVSLSRTQGIRSAATLASFLPSHSLLGKTLLGTIAVIEILEKSVISTPSNKALPTSKLGPNGAIQSLLLDLISCLALDKERVNDKSSVDDLISPPTMEALSAVVSSVLGSCQSQCNLLLQTLLFFPQDASMKDAIIAHSSGLELFTAAHDLLRATGDLARQQWRNVTAPLENLAAPAFNASHKRPINSNASSLGGGVGGWLGSSAAPDNPEGPDRDETLSVTSSQATKVSPPSKAQGGKKGLFNWGKKKNNKVAPSFAPPQSATQTEAGTLGSIYEQEESPQASVPQSPTASLVSNVNQQVAVSPGNALHTSWELVKVLEMQQSLLVSVRGCVFGLQKKLIAAMMSSIVKAYGGSKANDSWLPKTEPELPTQGTVDVVKSILMPLRTSLMQDEQLIHAQSRAFSSQAAWGLVLQALEGRVHSGARRASIISPSILPLLKRQVKLDCQELRVELGEYSDMGSRRVLTRQTSGLSPGIIAVLNKQLDSIDNIIRL